jgi:thiol-disulfide isomerase/thioredoxin
MLARYGRTVTFLLLLFPGPRAAQAEDVSDLLGGSVKSILESLQLEDLDGRKQPLSVHLGAGPVLLDFWAMWCKPCLAALPEIDQLYKELRGRGLRVVAINEDGPRSASKVKPFVRGRGWEFDVVLDLNREAQRRLNALALPTTLLLDAEGTVIHTAFGFRPGEIDELRALIEPLLLPADSE